MAPDDKILFVQTLSKNWAMTGLRIGWLEAPPALAPVIENLIQFTSRACRCRPSAQRPRRCSQGEPFLAEPDGAAAAFRDILGRGPRWRPAASNSSRPEGAFYLFPAVAAFDDARALAFRLIDEAGVGAAPGYAFGPGGEGRLRLCFARAPAEIEEATRRLPAG